MAGLKNSILSAFPDISDRLQEEGEGLRISFDNPRYSVWVTEEPAGCFIVGIGDLFNRFATGGTEKNLESALNDLKAIIAGEIAAVGVKGKKEDYLLCTMPFADAMMKYQYHADTLEIVRFTDGC